MRCPSLSELPPPRPGRIGWPWTEASEQLPDTIPDSLPTFRGSGRPWPRISIVTPSYNQGQFIEETIRSVLLQGYPDLEYIIIDGGSTDESVAIIRKYEKWLAHWVSEKDKGQADAINKGWLRATGDILAYLNSDDVYAPGAVELAASSLVANPAIGFVYGDARVIDSDGTTVSVRKTPPFDFEKLVTFRLALEQPTVFFRRSLLDQVGLLDTSLHMTMDTDYWLRLGRVTSGMNISQDMAFLRLHPEAKTVSCYAEFLPDTLKILDKFYSDPTLPRAIRKLRAKAYSYAYYGAAGRAYQAGVRRPILPLAWRALYLHPTPFDFKTYLNIFMCVEALTGTDLMGKLEQMRPRQRLIEGILRFLNRVS